jgi:CRISPR-associated protein Cas2
MHYVIAYDVESDKRRTRMMKKLKDKGERVQFSVFEVESDERRMVELIRELRKMMEPRTDRLHVYRMCESCYLRSEAHGAAEGSGWEG